MPTPAEWIEAHAAALKGLKAEVAAAVKADIAALEALVEGKSDAPAGGPAPENAVAPDDTEKR